MSRRTVTIVAVAAVTLVVAVVAIVWRAASTPDGYRAPIYSVRVGADDRQLFVTYSRGECETVGTVVVEETAESVRLAVFVLAGCGSMAAQSYELPVTLDAPLGSRRVVNDDTGFAIRIVR